MKTALYSSGSQTLVLSESPEGLRHVDTVHKFLGDGDAAGLGITL